ncbi:glutamine synthetase family protein [uncultured Gimesia sp.]|uniref:glutamine synthetase family protein n=1 Tax=uncultured Gimesia sp. TaxID=1678688 RepID=UPI0030D772F2|tara:strand:+ start:27264 stop:28613 length:1350 start_codon:yes stop_codon:yes gene_type:complete
MQRDTLEKQIIEHNVELVRAIYVGPDGITRGKAFRPSSLNEILESGLGLTQAQASVTVFDHLPPESEFQPVGEVRIRPDLDTFQVLPYLPGHARMLSDIETIDGQPWELCPRSLLKTFLNQLSAKGMVIRAAFENEFTIFINENGEWQPLDQLNCFSSAAMDLASPYILPIIAALEKQGVMVEKYYPEAGHGQHEIPVRHQPGMQAADQQVVFRETVRGTALANNFRVSFMPKPAPETAGNGCHIHFSLWDSDCERNLFYDAGGEYGLSQTARHFMAGILSHLPALMAFTAPTTNSYSRFVERCWSSCYVCWGPDNREATVRAASGFRGRESATVNLEYKPSDPTCNPYLALSSLICAGLDGIENELNPGEPVLTDPALLSPQERERRGLTRYPIDLAAALSALEQDDVLRDGLGVRRVTDYVTMKRAEIEMIDSLGKDAEQQAYLFRF